MVNLGWCMRLKKVPNGVNCWAKMSKYGVLTALNLSDGKRKQTEKRDIIKKIARGSAS